MLAPFAAWAALASLAPGAPVAPSPECAHGVVVNGFDPNAWKRAVEAKGADGKRTADELARVFGVNTSAWPSLDGAKADLWKAALWSSEKRDFVLQLRIGDAPVVAFALHPLAAPKSYCALAMPFVAASSSGGSTTTVTFSFENVVDPDRQAVRVFSTRTEPHVSTEETAYWELQDGAWASIFDVTTHSGRDDAGSSTQTAAIKAVKASTWPRVLELRESSEQCSTMHIATRPNGDATSSLGNKTCARSDSVVRSCYGPDANGTKKYVPCAR